MASLVIHTIDFLFDLSQHPSPQASLKLHFNTNDGIKEIEPCTFLLWAGHARGLNPLKLYKELPRNQEDAEKSDGQHGKSHHI